MKKTATALLVILILVCMCAAAGRTVLKTLYPQKYTDSVTAYSAQYGVDATLVYAVIRTESSFDPDAESSVGARGLMQIMPDTLEWLCYRMGEDVSFDALSEPDTAIRFGTFFLHLLMQEFGDERTALAAYHAGRGSVLQWLDNAEFSSDGKTLDRIPYPDTAHYVGKVERAKEMYQNLYE